MRKAVIAGAALLAVLTSPASASAGCWATVGLAPPPQAISAGDVWNAEITVLQHGRNPLPDARDASPEVTIIGASGERRVFTARSSDPAAGRYMARVVFPRAGRWSYEVFDGFTKWEGESVPCAQTHSFAAVEIGGSGESAAANVSTRTDQGVSLLWPLGGLGAVLVGAVVARLLVRRFGSSTQTAAS